MCVLTSEFMSRVLIAGIGGIGAALSRRLIVRGTGVHLVGRDEGKLSALATELQALAAKRGLSPALVTSSRADMVVEADVERVGAEAAAGGRLTGLVYAVGSIPLKPLRGSTSRDFVDTYTLNVVGGALLLKACLPLLTGGPAPGSAVFFSSVAASCGFTNHTAIAAAKGGVEALVRSAAAELAPKVRVNCVAPSLTDTPLAARLLGSDAARKALGDAHPLPRVGTADDSAAAAEWFLDDKWSGWTTGQVLAVDGGRSTLRHKN